MPPRMKGSLMFQGLKSLASRFHPQLPLTPIESQRLLNALTGSFRKQLDEAHPKAVDSDDAPAAMERANEPDGVKEKRLTSSSILADRHLASVLTSPLLGSKRGFSRAGSSYKRVWLDLQAQKKKDPISLLEEYHANGILTIPLAAQCFRYFTSMVKAMPQDEKQAFTAGSMAGKRTWFCLPKTELCKNHTFSTSKNFMRSLIFYLVKEGSAHHCWEWVNMDAANVTKATLNNSYLKDTGSEYWWKAMLVRSLIWAKLRQSEPPSADAALETFFAACELKRVATQNGNNGYKFPLKLAATKICEHFRDFKIRRTNTDAKSFDKFLSLLPLVFPNQSELDMRTAELKLLHPTAPSPLPAFRVLQDIFNSKTANDFLRMRLAEAETDRPERILANYTFMTQTADQLREHGRSNDAKWVTSLAGRLYPHIARDYEVAESEEVPSVRSTPTRKGNLGFTSAEHMPFPFLT